MRFYLDTEFIERGHEFPIELISIGLVGENGDSLYIVLADGWHEEHASEWVRENVLPHLGERPRLTRVEAAAHIREFVSSYPGEPEFWGYYADYDWVVFCQLFGAMINLPKGWPMFCRDVIQLCKEMGNPTLPKQSGREHNALDDARDIQSKHAFLVAQTATPTPPADRRGEP